MKIEIFGASHASEIGVHITGMPAGEPVDTDALRAFLTRRAPGRDAASTPRKEADLPEFLCGVRDGVTTGEKITAIIRNTDTRSKDYEKLRTLPRPSHADYTAYVKYKGEMDMRGGGPFSGRMTAPLCIAGGIAKQILSRRGITVGAHVYCIADVQDTPFDPVCPADVTLPAGKAFPVQDDIAGEKMFAAILAAKEDGDSVGGVVECAVTGMPAGYGGPLFEGVEGKIALALFGIPAVKGVEFGSGFASAQMRGSAHNDAFAVQNGRVVTATNNGGGIAGGITNGMPILVRAAFKPTPSIAKPQRSVNLETMQTETLVIPGRHDPCVVVRAVPVVEAAVALCLLDILEENS